MQKIFLICLAVFLTACTSAPKPTQPTGELEPVNKTLLGSYISNDIQ